MLGVTLLLVLAFFLPPLPKEFQDLQANNSLILTDRQGRQLRRQLSDREGVNRWVELSELPPHLIDAVLCAEDGRFYLHPGIDPLSIGRAAYDNLRAGQVVSGASTITQQLQRTLASPVPRDLPHKLVEAYWALRLDLRYSKNEILEAYLNRVTLGPSVYGVEEAGRYYFDKPASALSVAEATALAVIIRSPSSLDPFSYEGEQELKRWTALLLSRLLASGKLSSEQVQRARDALLELSSNPPPFLAPHFCDLLLQQNLFLRGTITTSLDLGLQTTVEGLVRTNLALLAEHKVGNAAVVVLEVQSGKIRALVGSGDYHRSLDGQHNAAVSLRQPGSTIKPFTYALLLHSVGQAGYILPDLNLYEDPEQEGFVPQNYDRRFHGPVSIRTALACSYNVPAIRALERVGVNRLLELLRRSGLDDLRQPPDHYGLGLTLGDGSASLLQLTNAYRVLARSGLQSDHAFLEEDRQPPQDRRVLDERSAYLVTDILTDKNARIPSFGTPNALEFPFPCAVKTGTSKGYRDNWAIGYTPEYVVGVWVGNSDGSPMEDVSGITGAGPLFRDIMLTIGDGGDFARPPGLAAQQVCSLSGQKANPDCPSSVLELCQTEQQLSECQVCLREEEKVVFDLPPLYLEWGKERGLEIAKKTKDAGDGVRFVFPQSGDVFSIDPRVEPGFQKVRFRVVGGQAPYRWELDGRLLETSLEPSLWWALASGRHTLQVTDAGAKVSVLSFEVIESKRKL